MKKLSIVLCLIMVGFFLQLSDFTEASPIKDSQMLEKIQKHHKRLIEKEKVDELIEKGYSKKEIFMGAIISRKANKSIDEVLGLYKKTKSWDATAKQLGVNIDELKRIDSIQKWKYLIEHNSSTVISHLAEYSNKKEEDIKVFINDGIPLRFLVGAAAMAKLSGKDLEEIIAYKHEGKSHHDIMNILEIEHENLHKELEIFRKTVQKKINDKNQQ